MKKLILTLVFGFVLAAGLKAQNPTLPTFEGKIVIMKVSVPAAKYDAYLYLDDGGSKSYKFELEQFDLTYDVKNDISGNTHKIAIAMNQLADQGYKLVGMNTESVIATYIFQKN